MDLYSYTTPSYGFQLGPRTATRHWQHRRIDFHSAIPTMVPETGAAWGELFQPVNCQSSAPLVVLLHGVGDQSAIPCRMLARYLAGHGVTGLVLYLPIHSSRMGLETRARFPQLTDQEWHEAYRVAVINVRQILDWASGQDTLANSKIGLIGISMGGFISAITMGIDDRVKASVLIVMGGNSAKIGQKSRRSGYRMDESAYQQLEATYRQYLADVRERGLDKTKPPQVSFLIDPLTYAERLQDRSLLMVNAWWDEVIPREATLDFWQASGRPIINWFPATHAFIWAWYPLIAWRVNRFLQKALR